MKNIVIVRHHQNHDGQGTFGGLYIEGKFFCFTGELPWRDNQQNVSCIPCGQYVCRHVKSPRFGRVFEVTNVKGRSHVLIHAANFCGDKNKGFKSDLLGCIALGTKLGRLNKQKVVLASRLALSKFHRKMARKPFLLTIIEV